MSRRLFIVALDSGTRPGVVVRLAQIFAERGISIEQILAADRDGRPTVALRALAGDITVEALRRRLERVPGVRSVAVLPGEGVDVWSGFLPGSPDVDGGFGR